MPSHYPLHTGDWQCKGCGMYFHGMESWQNYNFGGLDGPYCNTCARSRNLTFAPEDKNGKGSS